MFSGSPRPRSAPRSRRSPATCSRGPSKSIPSTSTPSGRARRVLRGAASAPAPREPDALVAELRAALPKRWAAEAERIWREHAERRSGLEDVVVAVVAVGLATAPEAEQLRAHRGRRRSRCREPARHGRERSSAGRSPLATQTSSHERDEVLGLDRPFHALARSGRGDEMGPPARVGLEVPRERPRRRGCRSRGRRQAAADPSRRPRQCHTLIGSRATGGGAESAAAPTRRQPPTRPRRTSRPARGREGGGPARRASQDRHAGRRPSPTRAPTRGGRLDRPMSPRQSGQGRWAGGTQAVSP